MYLKSTIFVQMHVIRFRSVECLPFPMIVASFAVSAQWLLYGIILQDPFITVNINPLIDFTKMSCT